MQDASRSRLLAQIAALDERQVDLVLKVTRQLVACHDPDVVQTFLAWRCDPKLESILDLAAALDDDGRDQLLFSAEDLYSEMAMRVPKARA